MQYKYKFGNIYSALFTVIIIAIHMVHNIVPAQVGKNADKLAGLNHCAVPFLSRAAASLCWYYYTIDYRVLK